MRECSQRSQDGERVGSIFPGPLEQFACKTEGWNSYPLAPILPLAGGCPGRVFTPPPRPPGHHKGPASVTRGQALHRRLASALSAWREKKRQQEGRKDIHTLLIHFTTVSRSRLSVLPSCWLAGSSSPRTVSDLPVLDVHTGSARSGDVPAYALGRRSPGLVSEGAGPSREREMKGEPPLPD